MTEQEYLSKSRFPLTNRQNLSLHNQMLLDAINLDDAEEMLANREPLSPKEQAIVKELREKSHFKPEPGHSQPPMPSNPGPQE
jgi:hypothetical protein